MNPSPCIRAFIRCLFAAATLVAFTLDASAQGKFETLKDIEIGLSGTTMMHVDMIRPTEPPASPMPVVFVMHSGGWKDGSYHNCIGRGDMYKKGFVVVSIEYHPAGVNARWPMQLQDCLRAVRWMRTNAAKYHVDPNRFAAFGESAGAHLATCVAVYGDDPRFQESENYPGVSAKLQAVVLGDGPLDIISSNKNHTNPKLKWNIENLLGGTLEKKPDAWKEACMVLHVSKALPPFFIWHGEKDNVISIDEAIHFVDALKREGVPVEFIPVKNGGHDAFGSKEADPGPNVVQDQMIAFLKKYLPPASSKL